MHNNNFITDIHFKGEKKRGGGGKKEYFPSAFKGIRGVAQNLACHHAVLDTCEQERNSSVSWSPVCP